jgi:DNA replicative helicase MCM subunit Mcm2 (Cdc46/Mcm family)
MASPPKLNDAQNGDLAQLWDRHAPTQTITLSNPTNSNRGGRGGRGGRGRGRGTGGGGGVAPTTVVTMELGDEEYTHICHLYSFFRWNLCDDYMSQRRNENQPPPNGSARTVSPDAEAAPDTGIQSEHRHGNSRTRQSLMFLFKENSTENAAGHWMAPEIRGGTLVVSFNHLVFMQELTDYENRSQPSQQPNNNNVQSTPFASYLHKYPDRAIACVGCAVGIAVLSAYRQNQPSSLPQNNRRSPQLSTLETAIYKPRFYNLSPSNQVRMAHIRTSTVDCLVSLRGTVTKARPKRLRVLDAGFTCCKCGIDQICKFVDGKYSSPTRCEDMKCRSNKFALVRKVANFCDVQELRIQEVREELCDDLENGDESMGQSNGNRESGRAPRHMEVEVANDLVDQCHAGDSIVVVGIVRAMNSALASGRAGKRAEETSTYKLYVVAHSIVNLTADDNVRGGRDADDLQSGNERGQNKRQRTGASTSGIDYTDQQLQQINNIAHADHLMYSMPTRMAFPFDLLVRSLCPSIVGNDLVKAGMILCLLGGTPPQVSGLEAQSGMTIRSNSHCLIVGELSLFFNSLRFAISIMNDCLLCPLICCDLQAILGWVRVKCFYLQTK